MPPNWQETWTGISQNKEIETANKYMNTLLAPLIIKKIIKYVYGIPFYKHKKFNLTLLGVGKNAEQVASGYVNWYNSSGLQFGIILQNWTISYPVSQQVHS